MNNHLSIIFKTYKARQINIPPFKFNSIVKTSLLIFICLISIKSFAQESEQIEVKKSELSNLKNEINELEAELKLKSKKEKDSFAVLENYRKQSFLLNKIINNLRAEEKQKESEINNSVSEIKSLEEEMKALQDNYARYIVAIYKNGKANELAGVIDSKSFEQALLRLKYLQKFSESREKDLVKLKESKTRLIAVKSKLEDEKKQKEILANQKFAEEQSLKERLDEGSSILKKIKNDKASLKKELDAKKSAEVKIKNLISNLIEEAERKRKEEAARLALLERERLEASKTVTTKTEVKLKPEIVPDYDIDLSTSGFTSFSTLKGRLNWPVASGKIIKKYGENRNSKLNTVTLNYGVDILASKDYSVRSVAEGVVSAIDWIPGYGSIIIITHKGDYRTVYSHLAEIHVKEGEKVKMGSVLAKVGESLEGFILHFEIWNSRDNQNPEIWLAKK